jgi:hypothetical protein
MLGIAEILERQNGDRRLVEAAGRRLSRAGVVGAMCFANDAHET